AANGSFLPGLLALAGPQAAALDAEFLRTACAELDSSEVYAGAYRLWRRITAGAATCWRPWTAARSELAMLGQERMLALHDGFGTLPGPARSKLHATLLLGEGGGALASPWQQWPVGQGWQASDGSSEPGILSEKERLRRCIRFVEGQPGAASVVHLFNFPGQTLLRELSARATCWLAHCPGSVRVDAQACPTTVAANAKTLDYRCLDSVLSRLDLTTLQGVARADVALWAAGGSVELAQRSAHALPVRQVSVRLID